MEEQNQVSLNESLIDSYMNSLATATHNLFVKTAQVKALNERIAILEAEAAERNAPEKGKAKKE